MNRGGKSCLRRHPRPAHINTNQAHQPNLPSSLLRLHPINLQFKLGSSLPISMDPFADTGTGAYEVPKQIIISLVRITLLSRSFIKIESVTQRIVLELFELLLLPKPLLYEGFPLGTGDYLGPLPELLERVDSSSPGRYSTCSTN